MLLYFKADNYKSFQKDLFLDLRPAPRITDLHYSVLKEPIGSKDYKALCSAVIYGPNAAGKTNIISAADTLKAIVLRGNIKNEPGFNSSQTEHQNIASQLLEYIPNRFLSEKEHTTFKIEFIHEQKLFEYELEISLGGFLNRNFERRVVKEALKVNESFIFIRTDHVEMPLLSKKAVRNLFSREIADHAVMFLKIANENLGQQDLFLTGGFKSIFNKKLAESVMEWFEKKFLIVMKSNQITMTPPSELLTPGTIITEPVLNKIAQEFGIHNNRIGYQTNEKNGEIDVLSVLTSDDEGEKPIVVNANYYESFGTIRMLNIFPAVLTALDKGATLIVDELDASIHPVAIINLLNIFHNDDINVHKAQLIFNTHNPIFMNGNVLRRDEMKFVDRKSGESSETYSLADFGTSGVGAVRKNEDYMSNYFADKYGAVTELDFSDIIAALLKERGTNEEANSKTDK